jgi:hypothetical protein
MKDSTKRYVSLALLAVAMMGLPLTAVDLGCSWIIKDPVTGNWRAPTPQEEQLFAEQTEAAAKAAVAGTPLAAAIPWIDALARLAALFAAWKIVPTSAIAAINAAPAGTGATLTAGPAAVVTTAPPAAGSLPRTT